MVPLRPLALVSDRKSAALLLHPLRSAILRGAATPTTCGELAQALSVSPQRVANHVRELVEAGLLQRVGSRQRRNLSEGVYQATARAFWLSPDLAHPVGAAAAAIGTLAAEAERIQRDASALYAAAADGEDIPSLTLTVDLALGGPEGRAAFARDLADAVEAVVRRHHVAHGEERYRLTLVGYPEPNEGRESET